MAGRTIPDQGGRIYKSPRCKECKIRFNYLQGKYHCKCGSFTWLEMIQRKLDTRLNGG